MIDILTKLSIFLLPLSLVKFFAGHQTYFQIFYIIIGAISFFQYKIWSTKLFKYLLLIFTINIASSYLTLSNINLKEFIQLGALISLIFLIKDKFTEYHYIKYSKVTVILALLISIQNYYQDINIYASRSLLGIPRVAGLIGEPNFTAFALIFPFIIFFKNRKFAWLALSTIPLAWTFSRAIIICLFILITLLTIKKITPKFSVKINLLTIFIFSITPLIISSSYKLSSPGTKQKLVNILSTRFYLTEFYFSSGIKNPFGVGLANGNQYYKNKGHDFRERVKKELSTSTVESSEQHSLYSQVFSEFGIIVYIFLIFIFFKFRSLFDLSPYFAASLSIPIFINSLNELTLFLIVAYFYKE